MDTREKVKIYKEMAERLIEIAAEKDFVTEVLRTLENDKEIMALKELLDKGYELVQAELYEELKVITNGRFHKDFSKLRVLRNIYLEEQNESSLKRLIDALCEEDVIVLCNWDMTADEEEKLKEAEIGGTVHIESKPIPALFSDEDSPKIACYVFTSKMEISQKSRDVFAICQCPFENLIDLIKKYQLIAGEEIIIYLDGESNQEVIITRKMLESVGY